MRSTEAASIILASLQTGKTSRNDILPSLIPADGIPRDEADRLWVSRLYDQGTARLRRSGVEAISFGGRTIIVGDDTPEVRSLTRLGQPTLGPASRRDSSRKQKRTDSLGDYYAGNSLSG